MSKQNIQPIDKYIRWTSKLTISSRFGTLSLLFLVAVSCIQVAAAQTTEFLPSQVIQREKGLRSSSYEEPNALQREGYNLINQGNRERGLIVLERAAEIYLSHGKKSAGIELLKEIEKLYNKFGQTSDAQRINRWISRQSN